MIALSRFGLPLLAGLIIVALAVALFATRATLADTKRQFADWRTAVANVQAEATSRAYVEKLMEEAHYAHAAENAQDLYDDLRNRYTALVRAKAAGNSSSEANLPRPAEASAVPADAAADSGVPVGAIPTGTILIPQADALICAENTAYAQAAHEWATTLANSSGGE